ncbi:pilus assembly protein PilM [Candidatus Sumerlaeota bacterium]|nr:pilus assembly protein PilM [Candidatus Sumerlaeota bacterium]
MASNLCGILIGADEMRAIGLRHHRGALSIAGVAAHDLSPEERPAPGLALRTMMKKIKPVPERAFFCLPKEQATLQHTSLPSSDPTELKEMARFEAERNIPFNAERHSVGYQILRDNGVTGSEVLLASADGPVVERVLKAAQDALIQPEGLSVSSACLVNAFLYAHPEVARSKTVMIASIGLSSLDLVFAVEGRLVFSRSVPIGLRGLIKDWHGSQGSGSLQLDAGRIGTAAKMIDMMDLDQHYSDAPKPAAAAAGHKPGDAARAWAGRLIKELRTSYDYARREMSCPPIEAIYLAGEGAILRNLHQYLYVNLNVEVEVLQPLTALADDSVRHLPFGGFELTVPFGAAIQKIIPGGYQLDLTPPAHYAKIEKKVLIRRAGLSGAAFAASALLAISAYVVHARNEARLSQEYGAMIDQLYPFVTSLKEEQTKLQILEGFLDDPCNALVVLAKLFAYKDAPNRVSVKLVSYNKADQVVVEGHAAEIQDLNNFAEYLRSLKLFDSVVITKQELRNALPQRPQVYEFHLQCMIPKFEPKPRARTVMDIAEVEKLFPPGETRRETEFVIPKGSGTSSAPVTESVPAAEGRLIPVPQREKGGAPSDSLAPAPPEMPPAPPMNRETHL